MAPSLKWLCAVPLFWLSACSCGNGPCQHLHDAEASLKGKQGNCSLTFTEFNQKRCEDKSGQCTNDDYQLIDTAASCLEMMGTCERSAQTLWLAEVQACHPSVSADCEPAVE
ncbi:MAG: hypothetical protein QM723_00190 [Myxococcaceae bacterium]